MSNRARLTGILMLIAGIILVIWPGSTIAAFCRLLGWCLVIGGAAEILLGIAGADFTADSAGGAVCVVLGIIFITRPGLVISFFPFLVGIVVAAGGALMLVRACIDRAGGLQGTATIAGSVIALIAGLILVFRPFSTVKLLMVVLGIPLIYFGILKIGTS